MCAWVRGSPGYPCICYAIPTYFLYFKVLCMGKFATPQVNPVCNPIDSLVGGIGVYSVYITPETMSYCIGTQAICQVKNLTIYYA